MWVRKISNNTLSQSAVPNFVCVRIHSFESTRIWSLLEITFVQYELICTFRFGLSKQSLGHMQFKIFKLLSELTSLHYLDRAMKHADSVDPDQSAHRSTCASAQSDHSLRCLQTESFVTIECLCWEQMPGWCESAHFVHARRYFFAWRGPFQLIEYEACMWNMEVDSCLGLRLFLHLIGYYVCLEYSYGLPTAMLVISVICRFV